MGFATDRIKGKRPAGKCVGAGYLMVERILEDDQRIRKGQAALATDQPPLDGLS